MWAGRASTSAARSARCTSRSTKPTWPPSASSARGGEPSSSRRPAGALPTLDLLPRGREALGEPAAHLVHHRRVGDVRVTAPEGRVRVVLEAELDGAGERLAGEVRHEAQPEVDPRGHAARGDAVPVD